MRTELISTFIFLSEYEYKQFKKKYYIKIIAVDKSLKIIITVNQILFMLNNRRTLYFTEIVVLKII